MGIGRIIGAAAPVAAGFMTGGASTPFLGMTGATAGLAAGALTGAGIAALSGEDPFVGGLTGALGGYGGADLAKGLGAFGGTTATNNAIQAQALQDPMSAALRTSGVMQTAAPNTFNPALTTTGGQGLSSSAMRAGAPGTFNPALTSAGGKGIAQSSTVFDKLGAGGYTNPNLGAGISAAIDRPMDFLTEFGEGSALKGGLKTAGTLGSPLLAGIEEPGLSDTEMKEAEKYDPTRRLNLNMDTGISEALKKDSGLRLLADGGYLETGGKIGDGMSDDIRASINNQQEAKLSDGEFVIPADVVSHLGNGSSDAGAKRLYSMMDKVRRARTGTKQQGKEISPERYMPA
jgi:hypothetical protein